MTRGGDLSVRALETASDWARNAASGDKAAPGTTGGPRQVAAATGTGAEEEAGSDSADAGAGEGTGAEEIPERHAVGQATLIASRTRGSTDDDGTGANGCSGGTAMT